MNISNVKYFSTVNGDGFRTAVFVSGCSIHCKGCFNKESWRYESGKRLTAELTEKILESIEPSYMEGLSILGGEPMDLKNQEGVYELLKAFRLRFGDSKTVWLWTGYTLNNLPQTGYTALILKLLDTIVEGPFKEQLYDSKLKFRGSSNQNIIELHH